VKRAERVAQMWKADAPEFIIKGCLLSTLKARGKNTNAEMKLADKRIKAMLHTPGDACSGKFFDETGELLLAAFSHRFLTGVNFYSPLYSTFSVYCQTRVRNDAQVLRWLSPSVRTNSFSVLPRQLWTHQKRCRTSSPQNCDLGRTSG
jgi:hypothetical protein